MSSSPLLNQITNKNFLIPSAFKFVLSQNRKIDFFCSEVNIPKINLGTAIQPTYLKDIPIPGDKLSYDDLSLRFIVDENMENYTALHNWMRGLGYPENVYEYQELLDQDEINPGKQTAFSGQSDGELIIYNSNFNPVSKVVFKGLFPTYLSTISFTAQAADTNYIIAEATFKYTSYDLITSPEPLKLTIIPGDSSRTCIAVVDETSGFSTSQMEEYWNTFRQNWPRRMFHLLQPNDCPNPEILKCPISFLEETEMSVPSICNESVFDYPNQFGYIESSTSFVEALPFNNATRVSIDEINNYGVIFIGLILGCGQLIDIISFLNTGSNASKLKEYMNRGGVVWVNSEWTRFGCSSVANMNTILELLGSTIRQSGDTAIDGNLKRSNLDPIVNSGFPSNWYSSATANFTGGTTMYSYTGLDYYGTTVENARPFVYEKIGEGILVASGDTNTYDDSTYLLRPPVSMYNALRNLVINT
jgi:hypothetical protein